MSGKTRNTKERMTYPKNLPTLARTPRSGEPQQYPNSFTQTNRFVTKEELREVLGLPIGILLVCRRSGGRIGGEHVVE
jgi:hypothetical protein